MSKESAPTEAGVAQGGCDLTPLTLSLIGELMKEESNVAVSEKPKRRRAPSRQEADRRQESPDELLGTEKRVSERRFIERRRQIDPTTCERDYQPDEVEFMKAMDDYKRRSGRQFPTWSEVLEVIRDLGYRKVASPMQTYE